MIQWPKVALIGEAPGEREHYKEEPFVGPAGGALKAGLAKAGLLEHKTYKMNVLNCRPPNNDINSPEAEEALECCYPGFLMEIEFLREKKVQVFMPLGNTALRLLNIEESITKARGSVYLADFLKDGTLGIVPPGHPRKPLIIVPTFHPSYIMRGQRKEEGTWINDFEKAKDIAYNGYKIPKENFHCFPSHEELETVINKVIKEGTLIGVDIETTGFNPDKAEIIVIGVATSGEDAFSIPFFSKGMEPYLPLGQSVSAMKLTNKLLAKNKTIFQNILFDALHLRAKGYNLNLDNPEGFEDIMLMHHAIHPELPHNLGYVTSIYGKTPYWKGEVLNHAESMKDMDDETLRRYNLRDSVVLHQIYPELKKDLEEVGTQETYNISKSLVPVILNMEENGITVDKGKVKTFKKDLEKQEAEAEKKIRELWSVHPNLNLSSDDDLRFLLYDKKPSKFKRAQQDILKYSRDNNNTKFIPKDRKEPKKYLRKQTKKYSDLLAILTTFTQTPPFPLPLGFSPSSTESGKHSVDKMALISLRRAYIREMDKLKGIKKPKKHHVEKMKTYELAIKVLEQLDLLNKASKLKSTYTDYKVGDDGRVRPSYIIHGTATGRLSSRSPNFQNQPKEAKIVFVSEEGKSFVQADYSNLEVRVMGYIANDKGFLNVFKEGKNVHDETTKIMFNLSKEDKSWHTARHACKTYLFGRMYGGGIDGIYKRIIAQVPELRLTFHDFKKADKAFFDAHPGYKKWRSLIEKEVNALGYLRNAFGRIRIFTGSSYEIVKEALNFPIQSTAADILNYSLIGLYHEIKNREDLKLVGTVHDSIILEVDDDKIKEAQQILKRHMERTFDIETYKGVSFPIDIEIGKDLKNIEEV